MTVLYPGYGHEYVQVSIGERWPASVLIKIPYLASVEIAISGILWCKEYLQYTFLLKYKHLLQFIYLLISSYAQTR